MLKRSTCLGLLAGSLLLFLTPMDVQSQDFTEKVLGETIFVPAYSRVFSHPNRSDLLAATLAIHNVDPEATITLLQVDYHNEDGTLLRTLLDAPVDLAPMQSKQY